MIPLDLQTMISEKISFSIFVTSDIIPFPCLKKFSNLLNFKPLTT